MCLKRQHFLEQVTCTCKKKSLQVCASDKVGWCFRVEWEARCGGQEKKKGDCTALTCKWCTVPEIREKQPTALLLTNISVSHTQTRTLDCQKASYTPTGVNIVQVHLNNFNKRYSMWKLRDTREWASARMGHRYFTVYPKGRACRKANLPNPQLSFCFLHSTWGCVKNLQFTLKR